MSWLVHRGVTVCLSTVSLGSDFWPPVLACGCW